MSMVTLRTTPAIPAHMRIAPMIGATVSTIVILLLRLRSIALHFNHSDKSSTQFGIVAMDLFLYLPYGFYSLLNIMSMTRHRMNPVSPTKRRVTPTIS